MERFSEVTGFKLAFSIYVNKKCINVCRKIKNNNKYCFVSAFQLSDSSATRVRPDLCFSQNLVRFSHTLASLSPHTVLYLPPSSLLIFSISPHEAFPRDVIYTFVHISATLIQGEAKALPPSTGISKSEVRLYILPHSISTHDSNNFPISFTDIRFELNFKLKLQPVLLGDWRKRQ